MVTGSRAYAMSREQVRRALIAWEGITTTDGAVTNDSLIDANLIGATDFITEKTILIDSGNSEHQDKGALAFNAGNGEITFVSPCTNRILAGTRYYVLNISSTELDVALLLARMGASGDPAGINTLFAWFAKVWALISSTSGSLWYVGTVTAIPGGNQFTIPTLAGLGAGQFIAGAVPWRAYVKRDAGGGGALPQGQSQNITGYVTATGVFTTVAFAPNAVGVGDEVMMLHPALAAMLDLPAFEGVLLALIGVPVIDLATDILSRAAPGAAMDLLAATITAIRQTVCLVGDPADSVGKALYELYENRLTAARAANLDSCSYLEQLVPIMMNSSQTLTNAQGNKDFVANNTRGGQGLISTVDAKVQKAFLLIIGRASNIYGGDNYLDCSTATHNQWQMNLDNGAYSDLVNGAFADGQMIDGDWRCHVDGDIHPFTLCFDITSQLTNVDGLIGVRLQNGRSKQSSLIVTCDIYLKILYKL